MFILYRKCANTEEYIDNKRQPVYTVLLTIHGAHSTSIMEPLIVKGETIEKQQIIFLRYFEIKIKLFEQIKCKYPIGFCFKIIFFINKNL